MTLPEPLRMREKKPLPPGDAGSSTTLKGNIRQGRRPNSDCTLPAVPIITETAKFSSEQDTCLTKNSLRCGNILNSGFMRAERIRRHNAHSLLKTKPPGFVFFCVKCPMLSHYSECFFCKIQT